MGHIFDSVHIIMIYNRKSPIQLISYVSVCSVNIRIPIWLSSLPYNRYSYVENFTFFVTASQKRIQYVMFECNNFGSMCNVHIIIIFKILIIYDRRQYISLGKVWRLSHAYISMDGLDINRTRANDINSRFSFTTQSIAASTMTNHRKTIASFLRS